MTDHLSEMPGYPLQWPPGWPRTEKPRRAQFATTFARARDGIVKEIGLLGGENTVIASNIPLRRDGLPYANTRQPDDVGVCAYFQLDGEPQAVPCDKWNRIEDNMQAVHKTIAALRGLERWGAKEMVRAAFRGFKALPMAKTYFLGFTSPEEVKARYKELVAEMHPDKGGNENSFKAMLQEYEALSK